MILNQEEQTNLMNSMEKQLTKVKLESWGREQGPMESTKMKRGKYSIL